MLVAATAFIAPATVSADTFDISGASAGWPKMSAYATVNTSTDKFGGTTWSGVGFANNNGGWEYLRFGAKSSTNADAYLSSDNPVEYNIEEVSVNVTSFIRGTVNSVSLLIADDNKFTDATSIPFTGDFTKAGIWTARVATPAANKYYKINLNYTNSNKKNGVIDVDKVTFTYTAGEVSPVGKPVITGETKADGYYVSISAEEGADVYYTIDGTEPTAASTKYSAPFQLWESCTVKAIAIKGEDKSNVATFNATVPMFLEGFGELVGLDEADGWSGTKIVLNCPMTVVDQPATDTRYLYVRSGYNNMLFYQPGKTFKPGDTFNYAEATIGFYGKSVQLTGITFGEVTPGTAVEPTPAELDQIQANNKFAYFKIEGLTISGVNKKNATVTDADNNTAALYNQFGIANFEDATNCTITGFVGVFNGNVQFQPTVIEVGQVVPAAPVIEPADGSKVPNFTQIMITAEEGATIMYRTSQFADEDPFEEYDPWSVYAQGAVGSQFTVEAYAEVDGVKSETVKAVYTISKADPMVSWINANGEPVEEVTWILGESTAEILPFFDGIIEAEPAIVSSNPDVAVVDMEGDPWLQVKAAGITEITMTVPETEQYEAAEATFTLIVEDPNAPKPVEATFDFTNFDSLNFATEVTKPTEASTGAQIAGNSAEANGVTLSFAAAEGSTGVRFWNGTATDGTTLRVYKGASLTFDAPANFYLTKIEYTTSGSGNWGLNLATEQPGTFTDKTWTAKAADKAAKVSFEVPNGGTNTFIKTIKVTCEPIQDSVGNITVGDENAPVEYYNLQGIRVENPTSGLYIRRQGSTTTKVIL